MREMTSCPLSAYHACPERNRGEHGRREHACPEPVEGPPRFVIPESAAGGYPESSFHVSLVSLIISA
jgi:hypothetical protein